MDRQARGGTLILGGGFAGSYVAKLLKKQGATIVSLENFMLFASMLPEAASGTLEPRHVVVPLRLMCRHADLVLGRAVAHEPDRRRVQVETDEGLLNITYRDLVVALGAIPRSFPIPGLAEYAFGFKDLADAIALRNHVLRRLEAAVAAPNDAHRRRELTFVFVGAGYAGVEALAELRTWPATRCATTRPTSRRRPSTGCSSTRRRRSSRRSLHGWANTQPSSWSAGASTSASAPRWRRSRDTQPCSLTAIESRRAPSSGRPAPGQTRCSRSSASRSTTSVGSRSTRPSASKACRTS
jgi:hypothetical protein